MFIVNQINAQVKLVEMWKSSNDPNYPIQGAKLEAISGARLTRAISRGDLVTLGSSQLSQSTFINDASRFWNKAPSNLKKQ